MKVLHRAAAVAVTAAIFYVLLRRIPLPRLQSALEQADYTLFFAAMIPNTLFYFCWDTLVLTVAVRWFHGPVRYAELLPARAASYVVAFFNTNAGRGALAAYLARRLGSPFLQLGSTVLFLVFSEYLHLVTWATAGSLRIRSEVRNELLWVGPAIALVWLAVIAYTRLGDAGSHEPPRSRDADAGLTGGIPRRSPLAARGEMPAAFDGRCIPAGCVAPPSNTPGILGRRALPAGRLARLGATPAFHHGLLARWALAPRGWALLRSFRLAPPARYAQIILLRAPMFFVSLCLHYVAARAFGLSIPFAPLVAFLPVIFMIAALPISVARLGTTQAAWVFFFGAYADEPRLLAFSLAAHLTFVATRALLGVAFLPRAYGELVSVGSR